VADLKSLQEKLAPEGSANLWEKRSRPLPRRRPSPSDEDDPRRLKIKCPRPRLMKITTPGFLRAKAGTKSSIPWTQSFVTKMMEACMQCSFGKMASGHEYRSKAVTRNAPRRSVFHSETDADALLMFSSDAQILRESSVSSIDNVECLIEANRFTGSSRMDEHLQS